MTKALSPPWRNRGRINSRCWRFSTASIGQPRWSPSKRPGLPGAARIRLIGRRPSTPSSNGNRANGTWSKARKAPAANSTTWQSNLAGPSGWRPPMASRVTPLSLGAAPPRSGRSIPLSAASLGTRPVGCGLSRAAACIACTTNDTGSFPCHPSPRAACPGCAPCSP